MYSDLKTDLLVSAFYNIVYMARRMLFTLLTFALAKYPNLIVMGFLYSCVLYLVYVGLSEPQETKLHWASDMFNEFMLIVNFYFFLLYLKVVADTDEMMNLGWYHIGVLAAMVLYNLLVIIFITLASLCRKIKLYLLKANQKK